MNPQAAKVYFPKNAETNTSVIVVQFVVIVPYIQKPPKNPLPTLFKKILKKVILSLLFVVWYLQVAASLPIYRFRTMKNACIIM